MSTLALRLQYPIILVHGLGARSSYGPFEYFFGIPNLLRAAGNAVLTPSLTAWHSIETRAQQLKQQILEAYPDAPKVNLIGHSMGGLDARWLTSKLDMADRIASVTTIGTPNRGTRVADLGLKVLPGPALRMLEQVLGKIDCSHRGLEQVSRRYHEETFGIESPNIPGVAYFSATSAIRAPVRQTALPVFWASHRLLHLLEGDNDGFVSVETSKLGEHICTYIGDHYGQIGQLLGKSRGLDHYAFFSEIVSRLKKEGF